MKLALLVLFSFLNLKYASSQVRCVNDDDGNCIAKGKFKKIKVKTTYGGSYYMEIREGKWELYNADGQKIAEGNYLVKNEASYQDGDWNYYSTDEILLFVRTYHMGVITSTKFVDTGTYIGKDEQITVVSDTLGNLNIIETKGGINYEYGGVIGVSAQGDPYKLSQQYIRSTSMNSFVADNDSMFLERFPLTRSTMNVSVLPVISPKNLISNGNFESTSDDMMEGMNKQIEPTGDKMTPGWGSSAETPDFYKSNGNCFAGFRVMGVNFEVLRNQLVAPLEAGKTYCLQFKLKLKLDNSYAFNGVSVAVSDKLNFFKNSEEGRRLGIVLQSHPQVVLGCRETWMVISGSFVADGGEKYLYISNFTENKDLKVFKADSFASDYINEIYYLIDDVVLIEMGDDQNCPCNANGCELNIDPPADTTVKTDIFNHPEVGQTIVLNNIQFETNKSDLLPESFEQLDSLVDLLLKFPSMRVEIGGHTDNKGKAKDNLVLSQQRADAVVKYLVEAGVDAEQLEAKGYGQDFPIDTNDNESGRFHNRRVEFKILEL